MSLAASSLQVLPLVFACALLTVFANLMMRYGLLHAGGMILEGGLGALIARLVRQPTFVLGVILYGVAALVWFRVLSIAEVSTSYPILVSLTFVMVTIGAVLVFKETITTLKIAGIAIILAGILLVARS